MLLALFNKYFLELEFFIYQLLYLHNMLNGQTQQIKETLSTTVGEN